MIEMTPNEINRTLKESWRKNKTAPKGNRRAIALLFFLFLIHFSCISENLSFSTSSLFCSSAGPRSPSLLAIIQKTIYKPMILLPVINQSNVIETDRLKHLCGSNAIRDSCIVMSSITSFRAFNEVTGSMQRNGASVRGMLHIIRYLKSLKVI